MFCGTFFAELFDEKKSIYLISRLLLINTSFTVNFDQSNLALLNKSMNLFLKNLKRSISGGTRFTFGHF